MLFKKQVRFEMTFEGWQGTAKPDIEGYVVPNLTTSWQTQWKTAGAEEGID